MAQHSHPLIRYETIDKRLRRRQTCNSEELARACGEAIRAKTGRDVPDPSIRTIKGDLARMRSGELGYEAPIRWDPRERTYRYEDARFSIERGPLREEDLGQLRRALSILKQYQGFEQAAGLDEVVARLESTLRQQRPRERRLVQLDFNPRLAGQQWLAPLFRAVEQQQCLEIYYQGFQEESPGRRLLSPYLLREYNNRWFLIGWQHDIGAIRNLPLDRIRGVEDYLLEPFYQAPHFNPDTYFRDIVGVTFPEGGVVEDVRLRVRKGQAPYLVTKPIHHSQEVLEQGPEYTVFGYRLMVNYELRSWLLALGESAEVLAPAHLREEMARRIREMGALYGGDSP